MRVTEVNRRTTCSGEMITEFEAGKRSIQLIGTFGDRAKLDDLLYSIACQRISVRLGQKRDNIVLNGEFDIIKAGK